MATFLDLPVEIRLQIYRHLIKSECHIRKPTSSLFPWRDRPGELPASHGARLYLDELSITQVSKKIYYEVGDMLGKALHYELDINYPNIEFGLAMTRLFEVIRVAPRPIYIRIKITLALGPGTIFSHSRILELHELLKGSWDPWTAVNSWRSWVETGNWEERRMRADAPASGTPSAPGDMMNGNVRLISGAEFLGRLHVYLPRL